MNKELIKTKRPANRIEDRHARNEADRLIWLFSSAGQALICVNEMIKICVNGDISELEKVKSILEKK